MNQNQIDKCEKIFKHYGREKQLIQLQEELGELQAAVAREIASKVNNMDEELADSLIMLEQFYLCDTKTNKNIDIIINDKLNRQLSRIFGEGYQDKIETEQVNGKWVKFDINNDGTFYVNGLTVLWFNWQHVLSDSYGKKNGYTAFGGWQYGDDPRWYLAPAIQLESRYWNSYVVDKSIAKPAIPEKIRFWRSTNGQY